MSDDKLSKRSAKRQAYYLGALLVQQYIDSGAIAEEWSEKDCNRLEAALTQLCDELHRRGDPR